MSEYDAGAEKASPIPSTTRAPTSCAKLVLRPVATVAPFHSTMPSTMMLRRLRVSAARPISSPAPT